jgi:hypothetical protein
MWMKGSLVFTLATRARRPIAFTRATNSRFSTTGGTAPNRSASSSFIAATCSTLLISAMRW